MYTKTHDDPCQQIPIGIDMVLSITLPDNNQLWEQSVDQCRPHNYRKTSNMSRTLVGNKIVYNSDVVGASPVGAAPTTSSFST